MRPSAGCQSSGNDRVGRSLAGRELARREIPWRCAERESGQGAIAVDNDRRKVQDVCYAGRADAFSREGEPSTRHGS